MNTPGNTNPIQMTAKVTGIMILMLVLFGPFSMVYVPSVLIVPGNATETATTVMAAESLLRLAIASDSIVFLIEIGLVVLLYNLVKPVSRTLSLVAAFARLAMTMIQGINLFNYFMVLLLVSGAGYLTVFTQEQLNALVLLFLNAHESVVLIWGLFFGFHLFVFGYLTYKSNYLPRMLGVLLAIAGVCYLIQSFGNILLPRYNVVFASLGYLSIIEIAFPFWLLVKGVHIEQWRKRTLQSA